MGALTEDNFSDKLPERWAAELAQKCLETGMTTMLPGCALSVR